MIPALNPLLDPHVRETSHGLEREMSREEALAVLDGPSPQTWLDYSNHASAWHIKGHADLALQHAYRAYELNRTVSTCVNLCVILEFQGRFEEALPYAGAAYACDPSDERAVMLYAESLLRLGFWERGWELYSQGHDRLTHEWFRRFLPEWNPRYPLPGTNLLVLSYGGIGDNLFFFRHLRAFRDAGARLTYVCDPSLVPLIEHQGFRALPNYKGNIPGLLFSDYDCFLSIVSLGKLQAWSAANPYAERYIRVRNWPRWRTRPRIGVCWKAGEYGSQCKTRFLTNDQRDKLLRVLQTRGTLVNLTYKAEPPFSMKPAKISNWLDTARELAKLDLLVTVDTGVAHLAGAMHIPTWVMLPGAAAWQYLLGYTTHPFYPTMRVFRNQGEGINQAVDSVIEALGAR
jgi:tetratricopeptide (TPR) repeat protein